MKDILRFKTICDAPQFFAQTKPNSIATEFEGRLTSYGEFESSSTKIAHALLREGIAAGDHIAWFGKNSDRYFQLLIAAGKIGAVMAPIGWRLSPSEAAYIVSDCSARMLFVGPDGLGQAEEAVPLLAHKTNLLDTESDDFGDWLASSEQTPLPPIDQQAPVVQLYTSGTTGRPKGVMLSHRNFLSSHQRGAMVGYGWSEWIDDDVSLVAMPVSHIGGTNWGLTGLFNGARSIIAREFDAHKILDFIEYQNVSKLFMVPAALRIVLDDPRSRSADFSRLRTILYGASPIPAALLRECIAVFKCDFCQTYGMTETTGTIAFLPPQAHLLEDGSKLAAAGIAMPGIDLRIFDENGHEVPRGTVGEVVTRSSNNMLGYWNLPEETQRTLDAGGWLHTGDAGYIDEGGFLFLQDRIKDMIISGGENIYPSEIESVLCDHPDVADAAVIGVADERWGEAVKAVVVRQQGSTVDEAAIISFVQSRIARFKAPKIVEFVDALPRNASGKILRRELRDDHEAKRQAADS